MKRRRRRNWQLTPDGCGGEDLGPPVQPRRAFACQSINPWRGSDVFDVKSHYARHLADARVPCSSHHSALTYRLEWSRVT